MRLVVWNCGGAVRKKWSTIERLEPDVAIVIECDRPDRIADLAHGSSAWMGTLAHKGLAVFGFGEWKVLEADFVEERLEYILPVRVSGPAEVDLYAVWASNHRAKVRLPGHEKIGQPRSLIDVYQPGRGSRPAIVAGDFNSSVVWDKPTRPRFAEMVARYAEEGFVSLYHSKTSEDFGAETAPTHWWRDRREDGPTYHIDYVFVPERLAPGSQLHVGTFEESVTIGRSDHAFMVAEIPVGH
jgi:exodeoxyribonuclease-3